MAAPDVVQVDTDSGAISVTVHGLSLEESRRALARVAALQVAIDMPGLGEVR